MNARMQIRMLPGGRLHLQDGPIDLIVEAFGAADQIDKAHRAAIARFETILDELCGELKFLRSPCCREAAWPSGSVARRMTAAVMPYAAEYFITPMASVAGAVAEEILQAMLADANLSRAYVNDGGDIAFHLAPGEQFVIGMVDRPDRPSLFGTTTLEYGDPVRGIATSGWRGRSFSLGIADAVTVLADRAAAADAAATVIANAVDLPDHPAITRAPACELAPDSDLGDRLVTQAVGGLSANEVGRALSAGAATAEKLLKLGLIRSAALNLQQQTRIVGMPQAKLISSSEERMLVHA
jgi:uncharacterized protein